MSLCCCCAVAEVRGCSHAAAAAFTAALVVRLAGSSRCPFAGEHGRGCLKPSASEWCALCELEKLAQQAYSKSSGCLNPKPLVGAAL